MTLRERFERALCHWLGHRWAQVAKEPVLGPFWLCTRCGRWER